jgi:hypothetical protein
MTLPSIPFFRSTLPKDSPSVLKAARRGDVQWGRRVFKAPPLRVNPPVAALKELSETANSACGR